MEGIGVIIALGLAVGALWLMTQQWFWALAFGLAGLASAFAVLASIVHFQILGALLFFFLMFVCWGIAAAIVDSMARG